MRNYIKVFLIGVAVTILVFGLRKTYKLGYDDGMRAVEVVRVDTIEVTRDIEIKKIVPEYIYKIQKDTISRWQRLNIDSLWLEALAYWQGNQYGGEYVAYKDTAFEQDEFKASVSFNSPLPLHPASYFNFEFNYKNKVYEVEKIVEVYKKMDYYLQASTHLRQKEFDYSFAVGYKYQPLPFMSFGNSVSYNPNNHTSINTHLTLHF